MRRCCTAQPPQWVKCRHTGAMRSGLASTTAMSRARSPCTSACTRSPASAYGTNTCPAAVSAMPSPCAPRRAMSRVWASPIVQRADQELDIAGAALDGRWDGTGDPPARLAGDPGCDRLQGALARRGVAHDAALTDAVGAHLELRLDERDEEG